jgi:hypothetical protein
VSLAYSTQVQWRDTGDTVRSFTSTDTTAPVVPGLADPLRVYYGPPTAPGAGSRALTELTFTIAGTRADVVGLRRGAPVSLIMTVNGNAFLTFRGEVTGASSVRVPGMPGVYRWTFTATDAQIALARITVGKVPYPEETLISRWERMSREAGVDLGGIGTTFMCAARPAAPVALSDMLANLLLDASFQTSAGRWVLDTAGTIAAPWTFAPAITSFASGGTPPLQVTNPGGILTLVNRAGVASYMHNRDACEFDLDVEWVIPPDDRTVSIGLTMPSGDVVTGLAAGPGLAYTRDTTLSVPGEADAVARWQIAATPPDAEAEWRADRLVWEMWKAPSPLINPFGLEHAPSPALVIRNAKTDTPAGPRGILAGSIREATLLIAAGRPTVEYVLAGLAGPAIPVSTISCDDLNIAGYSTITCAQVAAADTCADYGYADF